MDPPTFREKSTMTTLSDTLTSQLQMYINNNMVQSHINICSTNMKPDFLYDNLLDCSTFNSKPVDYKPTSNESSSWEYSHHHGFPFGRCITCPIVSSQSGGENDKDINLSLLRNIATHIKARAGDVMYKCGHCKASFEEKCDFINHMKGHTSETRHTSENCNTPNNQNSHNNNPVPATTENTAKRFVCQCCNTSYSRKSNLNAHMRTHADGKKPFACDYCEASYSRKGNLNMHVKVHTNGNKPFRCSMCEAAYSRKSSLDAHIRIHTDGSKPFRCDFCGAAYSRKTNLNSHVKIHTVGRQPFNCEFCNASYSRKTNLNAHVRTHTTGKISFKCEYCSVQYSRKTNLNTHVRTHTGEKPYKCKQCTETFSRRTDLNTHMKNHPSTPLSLTAAATDLNKTYAAPMNYLITKQNCTYEPARQNDNQMSAVR